MRVNASRTSDFAQLRREVNDKRSELDNIDYEIEEIDRRLNTLDEKLSGQTVIEKRRVERGFEAEKEFSKIKNEYSKLIVDNEINKAKTINFNNDSKMNGSKINLIQNYDMSTNMNMDRGNSTMSSVLNKNNTSAKLNSSEEGLFIKEIPTNRLTVEDSIAKTD